MVNITINNEYPLEANYRAYLVIQKKGTDEYKSESMEAYELADLKKLISIRMEEIGF